MTTSEPTGFILIDKPHGMTSSTCVQEIHSLVGKKVRVGHSGTLDAFATGLLIIGIGREATRELSTIMILDKCYSATAKLGQLTDTLDITGRVLEENSPQVGQQDILSAIEKIGSQYQQTPPVYSALKYQGRALSNIKRRNLLPQEDFDKIVKEKSRMVNIFNCTLTAFQYPFFTIETCVSHGTYIRSLIDDLAQIAGTHATTHHLRRHAIGPFNASDAAALSQFNTIEDIEKKLKSIDAIKTLCENYNSRKH